MNIFVSKMVWFNLELVIILSEFVVLFPLIIVRWIDMYPIDLELKTFHVILNATNLELGKHLDRSIKIKINLSSQTQA